MSSITEGNQPQSVLCHVQHDEEGDKDIASLLPQLERGCQIRDTLFNDVIRGFQNNVAVSQQVSALSILRQSIYAYYGDEYTTEVTGRVLTRESTEQLLTEESLYQYVFNRVLSGELYPNKDIIAEFLKVVLAMTECFPIDKYPILLNVDLVQDILLMMERISTVYSRPEVEDGICSTGLSIVKNMMKVMDLPLEVLYKSLKLVLRNGNSATVDFCHLLLTKELLPILKNKTVSVIYNSPRGSRPQMLHECIKSLQMILSSCKQHELESKICRTLVSVCEYSSGIDLLMERQFLPAIVNLANRAVFRYEAIMKELERSKGMFDATSAMKVGESITSDVHQVTFDAVSVISKMAFKGNRRQIMYLLEFGIIDELVKLVNCPISTSIVKTRVANALGNMAYESDREVQAIINAKAIPALVNAYERTIDHNTKLEAAYAICACAAKANRQQLKYIISCNGTYGFLDGIDGIALISVFMDLVCKNDPGLEGNIRLCQIVLNATENILNIGNMESKEYRLPENPYAELLKQHEGDIKLAKLSMFPNYQIAKRALQLSRRYFNHPKVWSTLYC
ncbi:hypothetical protein BBOV_II003740 [Babesia bovis T2Bo]|uniref:hypothetical protein n=1 Tax=Babesia bovis T2Bo TaxID=484906 RepID=UPI001C369E80|nr:hypothetical protein BBOV_II003740 [Babesia bovis T2Bo]EDO06329.2 hypothetical protein BBOV_II003740 [Babesia bovis T2Bo]